MIIIKLMTININTYVKARDDVSNVDSHRISRCFYNVRLMPNNYKTLLPNALSPLGQFALIH